MAVIPNVNGMVSPDVAARGQEIYDELMAQIEPELMMESLPTLNEKYANETPQQAAERSERYDAAFAAYDLRYAAYMADLQMAIHGLKKDVRQSMEDNGRIDDLSALASLESTISAL
jgi:hypothetical protein